MDTGSFIVYIRTDDIYKDIAGDVETRFDTSNYELDRPFPTGNNKKLIGLMIDEFVGLRVKTCNYLIGDGSEDKKAKGTKREYLNLKIIKTV